MAGCHIYIVCWNCAIHFVTIPS